ncbi:hypothetical protein BGX27_001353 [Mortierella sp. AM989]|nr:hypothetical protein BGX27_001353 [Mortierella sp. AM989]
MATDKGFPNPDIFKKYAHLVRSLSCNNLPHYLSCLVPYCAHLTELDVIDLTEDTLPLLKLNTQTLTCVKFKREHELAKRPFRVLEFLKVMNECSFLDTLRLEDFAVDQEYESEDAYEEQRRRYNRDRRRPPVAPTAPTAVSIEPTTEVTAQARSEESREEAVALFYQILHRITTLDIMKNVIKTPPPSRSQVFYRLRKLALLDSTMSYMNQLQLVSQCQYLTHLKLELARHLEHLDLEELATIQLEVACPNITHLDLSWSTLKDHEIAALLKQLPRLISFRAQRTCIGEKTMDMMAGFSSIIRDQLEELDLVDAKDMESAWIQRLLCSCAGLRRFRATEINARDIISSAISCDAVMATAAAESSTHESINSLPSSSPWVCLHLQELQLSITGISSPSSLQEQLIVYDQLSKLTQLQILSLGGDYLSTWLRRSTLELALNKGFERLKTLQELRVFNFSYMEHDLGISEIENGKPKIERHEIYIHRKWPLVQFSSK